MSGEQETLDQSRRKDIVADAFMLYRSFPSRTLTFKDIVKMSITHSRRTLWLLVILALIGGLIGLLAPIISSEIMSEIIPNAEKSYLLQLAIIFISGVTAICLLRIVSAKASNFIFSHANLIVQTALMARLLSLPVSFFGQYTTGDIVMRVLAVGNIVSLIKANFNQILTSLFTLANLGLMFYYAPMMALLSSLLCLFVIIALCWINFINQVKYLKTSVAKESELSAFSLQLLQGVHVLKLADKREVALYRWMLIFKQVRHAKLANTELNKWLSSLLQFLSLFSTIVIFVFIASYYKNTHFNIGDFIGFNVAFGAFYAGISSLVGAFGHILAAPIYMDRIKPILQALPERIKNGRRLELLSGELELNKLNFTYQQGQQRILKDISLHIKPGQFVAFVGPSGSGKSSLLKLILGFELPDSGSVFYDGVALNNLDIRYVRKHLGVVLQSAQLLTGSIYDNIAGDMSITHEQAWLTAKQVGLHKDISQMPMGMHTMVSEGMGTISGGQKQRILLARALANNPSMLILDEATSALDNQAQTIVSQHLEKLNITRLVVAHRLSTIKNADVICYIDHGQILERGNYPTLMQLNGYFKKFATRQSLDPS